MAPFSQDSLRITSDAASVTGSINSFGDKQLQADVRADLFIYDCLKQCKAVETASSEEQTDEKDLGGQGFTVGRDLMCDHQHCCPHHFAPVQLSHTR